MTMVPYEHPGSIDEAERIQEQLREHLDLASPLPAPPALVAGLDVSYDQASGRVAAAAAVVDLATLTLRECAIAPGEAAFPYVPGLLGFREVPNLLAALARLRSRPDVLICDGYGIAHPRRFGLACHVGVVTGVPTFGVAKSTFVGTYGEPGRSRGEWSPIVDGEVVLGRVLRTQTGVRPVFVSVGHRISIDDATRLTLRLSPRYRIPEAIRWADSRSREALRASPNRTSALRGNSVPMATEFPRDA